MIKAFVMAIAGAAVLSAATAGGAKLMPTEQQNKLVATYCAICHSDAHPNGKLSFEHFDAAHIDPGMAQMIASKLMGGAIGAAGLPRPDQATQDALLATMKAEAAGANHWVVRANGEKMTASIVLGLPSTNPKAPGVTDYYRLQIACDSGSRSGDMELEWSPDVAKNGREMTAAVDGKPAFTWKVEGSEKMGNGQEGTSGPGAVVVAAPLPKKDLTVSNLFENETVVFPFRELDRKTRRRLDACLTSAAIKP